MSGGSKLPARNVQEPITFSLLCEGEVFPSGRAEQASPGQFKQRKLNISNWQRCLDWKWGVAEMASSLGGSIQRKKFFSQAFEICNKPVFTSYYSWRNEISVRGYPGENSDIHSRVAVRLGAEGQ